MEPITPEALLGQLETTVARLAASPEEQWSWVTLGNWPADELTLSLDDQWPVFRSRLSETRMIDAEDERLLDDLKSHTESIRDTEQRRVFTQEGLAKAPEWATVRRLAKAALASLRRSPGQKQNAST